MEAICSLEYFVEACLLTCSACLPAVVNLGIGTVVARPPQHCFEFNFLHVRGCSCHFIRILYDDWRGGTGRPDKIVPTFYPYFILLAIEKKFLLGTR